MQNKILKTAITNAMLTAGYVFLIASFFFHVEQIFGSDKPDTVLAPMMMLLLFVSSAGLTAWLVLGRPVLWYLDGHKSEAVKLLGYTLGTLFAITILVFLISFSLTR
ncbi:MAG: hypothetical protein AAB364_01985 [Patescibacteria group bacterium]